MIDNVIGITEFFPLKRRNYEQTNCAWFSLLHHLRGCFFRARGDTSPNLVQPAAAAMLAARHCKTSIGCVAHGFSCCTNATQSLGIATGSRNLMPTWQCDASQTHALATPISTGVASLTRRFQRRFAAGFIRR
ncbi:hypothetical protein LG3211_4393 [Lysobacter gummosus]|nr:hypothetical protein LG3211_4393 [Lysobacter gummosus]